VRAANPDSLASLREEAKDELRDVFREKKDLDFSARDGVGDRDGNANRVGDSSC
jgi:hypothetical protein